MHYIVGLGNPGKEYENTRHNVGFFFDEMFVQRASFPSFHDSSAYKGLISQGMLDGKDVVVCMPHTYMNASGGAVAALVGKGEADKLIVIYDEVDLPLGELKVSFGRGDGGHNGIKSIIDKLGTKDFTRVRIGVGKKSLWTGKLVRPKGENLAKYVLGTFSAREQAQLQELSSTVNDLLSLFVKEGKDAVMNRFNR